ncbi:S8 family serine peptidase [candidate division KSB1 bacterium]|nr:S8 family serine peptidase [candidate division KSB1 bacterium]
MKRWGAWVFIVLVLGCGKKIEVRTIDDLPLFSYPIDAPITDVVQNDSLFSDLVQQVKRNQLEILRKYRIQEPSAQQRIYHNLIDIAILEGNDRSVLDLIKKSRDLEKKAADRLMTGLIYENIARTRIQSTDDDYVDSFREKFSDQVALLPWRTVQDQVKELKGRMDLWSPNLILGTLQSQLQPSVDKTGELSADQAEMVIWAGAYLRVLQPIQKAVVDVLNPLIESHSLDKPNIWDERRIALTEKGALQPIVVGIWDSGVDAQVFPNRMFVNQRERNDGVDNDGNGFVDDIHGIAFDLQEMKNTDLLFPISADQRKRLPFVKQDIKGLLDLVAAVDSWQSAQLKKKISEMVPEQVRPFQEELGLFSVYVHGTHVAGIAARDNPFVRILVARVTFDYRAVPMPLTLELAEKAAKNYQEVVRYFQQSGVRVVNMSWGLSFKEIESNLQANGIGANPDERRRLAREIFNVYRDGLYQALQSAPEILFVTAAGNLDSDITFNEVIPSVFDLPNILTVAAVDQAGDATSFTSFGASVDIAANGYEVEGPIPGGELLAFSGTSMAAPQVTNLAAKLLALNPGLTTTDLISCILSGADSDENAPAPLLNPARSRQLLNERHSSSR